MATIIKTSTRFTPIQKYIGLSIALLIPIIALVVSLYLSNKKISITSFVMSFGKKGTVLSTNANNEVPNTTSDVEAVEKESKFSVFAAKLNPILAEPSKMKITSLGLNVDLESVGVDEEGTMETPDKWNMAGWFLNGGKPGELRNLIINGHYDDNYGRPAAFWKLKNVLIGDTIEVIDKYGRIFTYKVLESKYFDMNDPTRLSVLEDENGKSTLTLITCGGVWNGSTGYTKRLVVKASLDK